MFNKLRHLSILLATATYGWSATVTVCGTGCTTTSLQAAFDSLAACGDTIQIKSTETQTGNFTLTYRGCAANPITVTSDRAAWLPVTGARITPSELANMAQITSPNTMPALRDALDSMGRPPAGWTFIGVAFTSSNAGLVYNLVQFGSYGPTGPSQVSNNITFDRCYFYRSSVYTGGDVQNVLRGDATNLTVKNSFFGDGFFNGVESHGISILTNPGPVTLTNNFVTTSGIPIFVGGSVPSYRTYLENGMTANYNYFWRPWKWNADPAQPYAADYATAAAGTKRSGPFNITNLSSTGVVTVSAGESFYSISVLTIAGVGGCTAANGSSWRVNPLTATSFQLLNFPGCNSAYTGGGTVNEFGMMVCKKNLGEMKWGVGATWQYNVGENSWFGDSCGQQFNGFTDTLRTEWDSTDTARSIGTFSMTDTTHISWSGTYRIGGSGASNTNTQDLGICLFLTTGVECHPVASFSGASLVSSAPFSSRGSPSWGAIVYAASAQLTNLTVSHNVWKNVDLNFSVLAVSPANGAANDGYGNTQTISQNLFYATTSYITNPRGVNLAAGEFPYNPSTVVPKGYTIDHNTFYNPNGFGGSFVYLNSTQNALQLKFDSSAITNNLFGVSSAGGNGPFAGDGMVGTIPTANAYFTNSSIKNNAIPGASNGNISASGGNVVSGNLYNSWSDPFGGLAASGIFNVVSSSPYYHAGTDGASIGADFTQLPMINNVVVTPAVSSATLQFDVSAPNADVKGAQICVLEVSSNRNLFSDLGSYTVIPDLDPTINQHADLSTRSDVLVSGNHVTWPLNGLSVATAYYGRLMCHGDTEWFTFQTPGASACDLNFDGVVSVLDVQLAVNMSLGTTPCTANINGTGVCAVTTIQRVVNAALGGACVTGP